MVDIFKMLQKAHREIEEFVEAIHYRDFSRNFNIKHSPIELKSLRLSFNEVNNTFKVVTKEKEMQFQYLQKMLELVDTGIISFELESGNINWMNDSFKRVMDIPTLKTIGAFKDRNLHFFQESSSIRPGENKVIAITKDHQQIRILLSASIFQTEGKTHKIIACQNINETLDEAEAMAWQKLLRVMTHEIMNSVAPISSLAATLKDRIKGMDPLEDLSLGLETIQRRSEGLLKFAETYRNLSKITKPNLNEVCIRDLFRNLHFLMQPTLDQKNIEFEVTLKDRSLKIEIDLNLIEQVLINILVNAMEALKEISVPKISMSASELNHKILLKISDNGAGISPDILDKIFIPFFSTKKNGSGIGLSLCQQIMLLHKGSIQVRSRVGEGSLFILQF